MTYQKSSTGIHGDSQVSIVTDELGLEDSGVGRVEDSVGRVVLVAARGALDVGPARRYNRIVDLSWNLH